MDIKIHVVKVHCLLIFAECNRWKSNKQDGRLAPAYFSQEYKYFDQHLATVKNETTV